MFWRHWITRGRGGLATRRGVSTITGEFGYAVSGRSMRPVHGKKSRRRPERGGKDVGEYQAGLPMSCPASVWLMKNDVSRGDIMDLLWVRYP
jgi:hypothetical protein